MSLNKQSPQLAASSLQRSLSSILIAASCLLVIVVSAHSATIFQTTFNCNPWDQSMGLYGVITCPGVSGFGSWATSGHPNGDEITSAANNPAGGGALGCRHWRGDGQNNNGGAVSIGFSPTRELWVRYYMRYQQGFNWANGSPHYTKELYFHGSNGVFVLGFSGDSYGLVPVIPGGPSYRVAPGWNSIMGGNPGDGLFHCYEDHVKWDTNGSNGIAESWVDGAQISSNNNVNFGTTGSWDNFELGGNQNSPSNGGVDFYTDYDDVAISDSGHIGCLGGTPPPRCDVNADGSTNVTDVQLCVNQAIGISTCGTGDINQDNQCNVVDVQRVVNSALGGPCVSN